MFSTHCVMITRMFHKTNGDLQVTVTVAEQKANKVQVCQCPGKAEKGCEKNTFPVHLVNPLRACMQRVIVVLLVCVCVCVCVCLQVQCLWMLFSSASHKANIHFYKDMHQNEWHDYGEYIYPLAIFKLHDGYALSNKSVALSSLRHYISLLLWF